MYRVRLRLTLDLMEAVMPSTNPNNANSSIIQHGLNAKTSRLDAGSTNVTIGKPDLSDLVVISKIATEKQQQNTQLEASKQIKDIAVDVVKVSSTIGKARSSNHLTNSQAIELYQKIAKLL